MESVLALRELPQLPTKWGFPVLILCCLVWVVVPGPTLSLTHGPKSLAQPSHGFPVTPTGVAEGTKRAGS